MGRAAVCRDMGRGGGPRGHHVAAVIAGAHKGRPYE
jgi:hypothetical protein